MKLLLIFILCSAFIAFKPERVAESIVRRPERVQAFAAVQTQDNTIEASTTLAITITTTAGNLVVLSIYSAVTVSSVTDNAGNTYVIAGQVSNSYYLTQVYGIQLSGATSITVTCGSESEAIAACADEFSGFGESPTNAAVFDETATNTGCCSPTSVSLTPAASGYLIVSSHGSYSATSWTQGTGFTLYGASTVFSEPMIVSQYDLSGTTSETAPVTYAGENSWEGIASSFKVAAATNTGGFFNFFKP